MTPEALMARVSAVLAETFALPAEQIVPSAKLREDLDLDSIDLFDLSGAIEREFGVPLDVADFKGVDTLESLVLRMNALLTRELGQRE